MRRAQTSCRRVWARCSRVWWPSLGRHLCHTSFQDTTSQAAVKARQARLRYPTPRHSQSDRSGPAHPYPWSTAAACTWLQVIHPFIRLLTHSLTHSLTPSHTHSSIHACSVTTFIVATSYLETQKVAKPRSSILLDIRVSIPAMCC